MLTNNSEDLLADLLMTVVGEWAQLLLEEEGERHLHQRLKSKYDAPPSDAIHGRT